MRIWTCSQRWQLWLSIWTRPNDRAWVQVRLRWIMVTWAPHSQRSSAMSLVEVLFYPPSLHHNTQHSALPGLTVSPMSIGYDAFFLFTGRCQLYFYVEIPNAETSFMRRGVGANDHGPFASCGGKTNRFCMTFFFFQNILTGKPLCHNGNHHKNWDFFGDDFQSLAEISVLKKEAIFNLSVFEFLQPEILCPRPSYFFPFL